MKCKNTSARDASRLPCCLSFEVWACVSEVKESIPARHNVIILLNVRSNFCYWSTFSAGYCLTLPPTWSFLVRYLADIFARIVHFEILEISCQQTESTKSKNQIIYLENLSLLNVLPDVDCTKRKSMSFSIGMRYDSLKGCVILICNLPFISTSPTWSIVF